MVECYGTMEMCIGSRTTRWCALLKSCDVAASTYGVRPLISRTDSEASPGGTNSLIPKPVRASTLPQYFFYLDSSTVGAPAPNGHALYQVMHFITGGYVPDLNELMLIYPTSSEVAITEPIRGHGSALLQLPLSATGCSSRRPCPSSMASPWSGMNSPTIQHMLTSRSTFGHDMQWLASGAMCMGPWTSYLVLIVYIICVFYMSIFKNIILKYNFLFYKSTYFSAKFMSNKLPVYVISCGHTILQCVQASNYCTSTFFAGF